MEQTHNSNAEKVQALLLSMEQTNAKLKTICARMRELEHELVPLYQQKRELTELYRKLDLERWEMLGKEIAVHAPSISGKVYAAKQVKNAIVEGDKEKLKTFAKSLTLKDRMNIINQLQNTE